MRRKWKRRKKFREKPVTLGELIVLVIVLSLMWSFVGSDFIQDLVGRDFALFGSSSNVVLESIPTPFNASSPPCSCASDRRDCSDFDSLTEAQTCFDYCFEDYGDVHQLDIDSDGLACELFEYR